MALLAEINQSDGRERLGYATPSRRLLFALKLRFMALAARGLL